MEPRFAASALILALSIAIFMPAFGQEPGFAEAASADEMEIIRGTLGTLNWSDEERERILSIEGWRFMPGGLTAFVSFEPTFVQASLCIAWQAILDRQLDRDEYEWNREDVYHYWLAESASGCAIESFDDLPISVLARDPVPTGAIIQILESEDEILRLTLERWRERDAEQASLFAKDLRLEEISLSSFLDRLLGFPYSASFGAPNAFSGPTCTFAIRDGETYIRSIGAWIE